MGKYPKSFLELVREYENTEIEYPNLKAVSLAMWLLESGRGTSLLAKQHQNYGGIRYNSIIKDVCKRINYKSGYYCEFANHEDFIKGFWGFLEQDVFDGWMNNRTSFKFISHIAPLWSEDDKYGSKVMDLLDEASDLLAKAKADKMTKIAIVIGHNEKSKGALSIDPLNQNEFDFNSKLANIMANKSKDYSVITKLFYRIPNVGYSSQIRKVYSEVNEWNADYSIELHFNAGGEKATGSEVLCSDSAESRKFATLTQKELVKLFKRKGKTNRGVKKLNQGDRGYLSTVSGSAAAIIVEPFFGSNKSDCELMVKLGLNKLAESYLSAMSKL